jgi:prevent-host-death family protein
MVTSSPEGSAWTVAEAKARFSEVVAQATKSGPQVITRRGEEVAVVVSTEEWHRKTRRVGGLADFFADSPLAGSELEVTRASDPPREVVAVRSGERGLPGARHPFGGGAEPELGKLHTSGSRQQVVGERGVLADVADEGRPLGLEAIVELDVGRNQLPMVTETVGDG